MSWLDAVPDRWTPAVLTQPWQMPDTTWRAGGTIAAGTAVVVQWNPKRKHARVWMPQRWGGTPLFTVPLSAARKYVKRTGR
jgi:hypothetical protein